MQLRELNWSTAEAGHCLQAVTPFGYYEIMNKSTCFLAGGDVQTAFSGVTIEPPMIHKDDTVILPYVSTVAKAKEMCAKHHAIMVEVCLFDRTY